MPVDIQSFDLFFSNAIRSVENWPLDLSAHILTAITYGGALWVVLAAILWRRGYKLLATQIGLALIIGLAEASILKHIFHRSRPIAVDLYQFWMPFHTLFADKYSFPSGHTVMSFAAACVIFYRFRDWRGWSAMLLAAIVGLCRIYEGKHWPTDVLAGVVLGIMAGFVAMALVRKFFPAVKDLG